MVEDDLRVINGRFQTGGWISGENVLEHQPAARCWVGGNARAVSSRVQNDALITDSAYAIDSRIFSDAVVRHNSHVYRCQVGGRALVRDSASAHDSQIIGTLRDNAIVRNCFVDASGDVGGYSQIFGASTGGRAVISGGVIDSNIEGRFILGNHVVLKRCCSVGRVEIALSSGERPFSGNGFYCDCLFVGSQKVVLVIDARDTAYTLFGNYNHPTAYTGNGADTGTLSYDFYMTAIRARTTDLRRRFNVDKPEVWISCSLPGFRVQAYPNKCKEAGLHFVSSKLMLGCRFCGAWASTFLNAPLHDSFLEQIEHLKRTVETDFHATNFLKEGSDAKII
jgi:hypothetical protein